MVGLSPMDGVTDAAFRYMVCKYSRPSVVFTEFTNVEGLARGADKMLRTFIYNENERPIVAQIVGIEVESFYKAAVMLCTMGFDEIDINMGCPASKIAIKGAGGGLIQNPKLAKKIILAAKKGVQDWRDGISLEKAGVHPNIIAAVGKMIEAGMAGKKRKVNFFKRNSKQKLIPVSVKTRIGYNSDISEEWAAYLISADPAVITMHGRTLKQMYSGEANWDVLAKVARICKEAGVMFLGNGDVHSMDDAIFKIKKYGVDGVLVGRAVQGNPWFFDRGIEEGQGSRENRESLERRGRQAGRVRQEKVISKKRRLSAMFSHIKYFEKLGYAPFHNIKKHLAWYCKGFIGARELRMKLMRTESFEDVRKLMKLV